MSGKAMLPPAPPKATNAERVLAALRARAEGGVTCLDWTRARCIDGGRPIGGHRFIDAIRALRAQGHEITHSHEREGYPVFILVSACTRSVWWRTERLCLSCGSLYPADWTLLCGCANPQVLQIRMKTVDVDKEEVVAA